LDLADEQGGPKLDIESRASLQSRIIRPRLITDDNMGTEWE
jgi:hypothetical protein